MPSIKPSPSLVSHSRQDAFPSGWLSSSQDEVDPLLALKERFDAYNEGLARADEMAAKHVYHNRELSLLDVRQHRMILNYYLYKADELAVDFLALKRSEETAPFVTFLDEQIERLLKLFSGMAR